MKNIVIGFAGKIGSGKTTVSIALANLLGWPRVSFGDYVRSVARQRGIEDSRENLQQLGEALLADGTEDFCRKVMAQANWLPEQPIIVDGIRHERIVQQLRSLTHPLKFVLIYISLDEPLRQARLLGRNDNDLQILPSFDAHSTEIQLPALLSTWADIVIDGSAAPLEAAQPIYSELNLRQRGFNNCDTD